MELVPAAYSEIAASINGRCALMKVVLVQDRICFDLDIPFLERLFNPWILKLPRTLNCNFKPMKMSA